MRKLLLTACALVALIAATNAQEIFAKRDFVGHVGIGIGSYLGGSNYTTTVPPILISGEYGILDSFIRGKAAIGVGGYLAYTANKLKINSSSQQSFFIIGARGVFHYQFVEKLDTYAGLMLGYQGVSTKNLTGGASSGFCPASFIGVRYYFSDRFAAFSELGYGIAALEFGIAIKL
ncbi:MAG: hypothetical protein LBK12_01750 [Odoribacteraceae bacterium]|jgi:hypothetical protein|nr:hypothetical protein [Odoribacteraceae bacterium]